MKTFTKNPTRQLIKWLSVAWLLATLAIQRADAQACQFQQGQNGGVRGAVISPIDFARGNVNGSKAHYVEGNSIPYRIEFTTLAANTQYRATISFNVKKQTKYAIDYITGFQNLKFGETDPSEQGTLDREGSQWCQHRLHATESDRVGKDKHQYLSVVLYFPFLGCAYSTHLSCARPGQCLIDFFTSNTSWSGCARFQKFLRFFSFGLEINFLR